MARIEVDPNYSSPTFSRATASTDLFKKEDVQALAAAISTHTHDGAGKGLAIVAGSIPNGVITSAMIVDGTITGTDIADGSVATAELANGAVTNAKLAADTARANLLTNGGFEVWQRGNGPFTTQAAFAADRWAIFLTAGDTLSVTRDTNNTDNSLVNATCVYTKSTGLSRLYQYMKRSDGFDFGGRTITVSVRVRTATANAVRLALEFDGAGGTTVYSSYHSGGGTYETLTLSQAIPANFTYVYFHAANFNAACTAYLDNAMLVIGSVAADFAPMHPADDLARCQRYYEILGETTQSISFQAYASAGGSINVPLPYKARKPVTPTATKVGTWGVANCAQPTVPTPGYDTVYLAGVATALGMAQFYNNAACNITLEANP